MKMGIGVGVLVLNQNDEVLLLLRNQDKNLADSDMRLEGTYTLPSGKVRLNETFLAAAKRKLKDEANLDVDINDLELVSLADDINQYAHYATAGFLVKKYSGQFKLKDSLEFTDYGWFNLNSLPKNLCEPSKKIINNYLNKTIYSNKL